MALETYQDLMESDPNEVQDASFAKIAEIYDDGVTLIFDGMEEATQKRYQTNSFVVFKVGDRVRVIKDSGTYVVEYPVGAPRKSFNADYAINANSAHHATNAEDAQTSSALWENGASGNGRIYLAHNNGAYDIYSTESGRWSRISTTLL